MNNLFFNVSEKSAVERLETVFESPSVRIERIVSCGQSSPPGFWYDQPWDEWVVVLRGSAQLTCAGETGLVELGEGDWHYLPAHQRHRVEATNDQENTVWLAIHFPPNAT